MRQAAVLGLALVGTILAGCVTEEPDLGSATMDVRPVVFELAGEPSTGEAALYLGRQLVGPSGDAASSRPPFVPQAGTPACDASNCESVPLVVHDTGGLPLAFMIEWEGQDETWSTTGGPGYYLGDAATHLDAMVLRDGEVVLDLQESFHYGGAGILADPQPGNYTVQTVSARGTTTYLLVAQAQREDAFSARAVGAELLPDLVALPPDHPTFQLPFGHEAGVPLGGIAGGCGPDESVEDQDVRCLRFAGIIGNQGPGEFLTVLEYDEAQASMAGLGGHWEQVVQALDGTERRVQIGPADYHEVHGHFHILDFVATQLYGYDVETGTRGDPVGDGRKMGFCVIDGGIIDTLGPVVPPQFHGGGCCYIAGICQVDMLNYDHFRMGMSPNWYDIYPWWRSDQYVEVSNLPDGVYELVTIINPDGLIEEADYGNNEAGSVLRVAGGDVEVVSMRTQAKMGPHPDADWGYAAQQAGST